MRRPDELRRCVSGASAVEFALLAPAFVLFLLGLIESCRIMWVQQVVAEAAFRSARCASMRSTDCQNSAGVRDHAVARGAASGVTIAAVGVAASLGVTCNGYAANRVEITYTVDSPLAGLLPGTPATLTTRACFPVAV